MSFFLEINMAPKKNAFYAFINHHKNQEMRNGKQPSSFQVLANQLRDTWNVSNKYNNLLTYKRVG